MAYDCWAPLPERDLRATHCSKPGVSSPAHGQRRGKSTRNPLTGALLKKKKIIMYGWPWLLQALRPCDRTIHASARFAAAPNQSKTRDSKLDSLERYLHSLQIWGWA